MTRLECTSDASAARAVILGKWLARRHVHTETCERWRSMKHACTMAHAAVARAGSCASTSIPRRSNGSDRHSQASAWLREPRAARRHAGRARARLRRLLNKGAAYVAQRRAPRRGSKPTTGRRRASGSTFAYGRIMGRGSSSTGGPTQEAGWRRPVASGAVPTYALTRGCHMAPTDRGSSRTLDALLGYTRMCIPIGDRGRER
jgi:hypothetical protein